MKTCALSVLAAFMLLPVLPARGADALNTLLMGAQGGDSSALKSLTKAAEDGNAYAQCLLGYYYENPGWERTPAGDRLPPPNMPEVLRWYGRSAAQGWAGGQYLLGLCYLTARGVDLDEEHGLELIRKAADQHHAYAMLELANLYTRGVGKPRNEQDRPVRILERLVASKPQANRFVIRDAYENLILRYEHGIGTEPDAVAAAEWHCRAALAGIDRYSLAEPKAGDYPRTGPMGSFTGEPGHGIIAVCVPDSMGRSDAFARALSLYRKAACGDGQAAAQIGHDYVTGQGAPQSPTKAWLWFTWAIRNGAAKDLLSRCETGMTPKAIAQAKAQWPAFSQRLDEVGARARLEARPIER